MSPVVKYFQAEKIYCVVGGFASAVSILVGLYFLFKERHPFYTGIAYPFLILGFFFLVICTTIVLRTASDISRVNTAVERNDRDGVQKEAARMEKVMASFRVVIIVEIVLIIASVIILFVMKHQLLGKGIAAGLLIQAGFFLAFDLLAQSRGKEYVHLLRSFSSNV
jgi:hypothetical protein